MSYAKGGRTLGLIAVWRNENRTQQSIDRTTNV